MVVTLVMDNGMVGPKFASDDHGIVQIPEESLRSHDRLLADKAGYFLSIQKTLDVGSEIALQSNRPVRGQLVNVPPDLEQTHSLHLWLDYRLQSLPDPDWSRHFENSDRNAQIRTYGLQGHTILIDPAFQADGEVSLVAIPRIGGGSETLAREPLPIGREWIELDLRNVVTPALEDSSLRAQIVFDAPGPTGEFFASLRDGSGTRHMVAGGGTLSRDAEQRSVTGVWANLKPGVYTPVLTFINQVTYHLDAVDIDGATMTTLRVGSQSELEAIVDIGERPREELGRVRVFVYDTEGRLATRTIVPLPEATSVVLRYLSPGEYTVHAEADAARLVSENVKAEVREAGRSQAYLEMQPGHTGRIVVEGFGLESVGGTGAREGVLTVRSSDGTVARRTRYLPSELARGRVATHLLTPANYEVVLEVDVDGEEFRAAGQLDLRDGNAEVSLSPHRRAP